MIVTRYSFITKIKDILTISYLAIKLQKRELPVKAAKLCAWVLLVVSILSLGFMFMLMHYLEKTIPCPYFDPDM
ncbi:hypothetical protein O3M35_006193 [Rhynocoris fuscipes]|uniref:Uncharacterized protein n=1 Tax=Rhynocoris fuscipes TaxID=488301 RepID=A0AAW1DF52_9HEMI